ncbi:MAG: DUF1572 family protein [Candidatus Hydrogenedentes bacterium]|nr:DUF1572 family protein [Candidatus Hydrogenedentota bacterium]
MDDTALGETYLESARARYRAMKQLGEQAIQQMGEEDLHWSMNDECNSVAILIQHLRGNMLSRWTDALTADGEKPGRNRDGEFVSEGRTTREALLAKWEEGWGCLLDALDSFSSQDLLKPVTIRGQELSLLEAINLQIFHTSYHVGQIVQIAKERLGERWVTASIPRGQSDSYRPRPRD